MKHFRHWSTLTKVLVIGGGAYLVYTMTRPGGALAGLGTGGQGMLPGANAFGTPAQGGAQATAAGGYGTPWNGAFGTPVGGGTQATPAGGA